MNSEPAEAEERTARWQPLTSIQRRVVGVLIEKAKTTPDAYPMTLNGLVSGCNQKSNRSPQMNLTADDVEQALADLRDLGAVAEVQGSGRVAKYRHYMYEWLGVDKVGLAVMAELLLRGEQTVGELRGRAARMEPIADLAALRPVLESLVEKKLVVELTPEGRGQIVSHGLYQDRELQQLIARVSSPGFAADSAAATQRVPQSPPQTAAVSTASTASSDAFAELQLDVAELRAEVGRLRSRVSELEQKLESVLS